MKAALDGEYVKKMGFAMDIKCIFKTVIQIFTHEGVVEGGTGSMKKEQK